MDRALTVILTGFTMVWFSPRKRKPAEAAYDCHIITKIIPPARIEGFVDSDFRVKQSTYESDRGYPTMPDAHPETSRFFLFR